MRNAGINYVPHNYINSFHKERNDFKIRAIVTGYGGGKTYAGCMELLQVSAINQGVPNVYIEPTHQMIKDILEPEMIQILENNSIPYLWNKTDHNFYFPMWDGHIWLRSGDKPEKLKGINVGLIGIDEPFIQDEEIYKIAVSRSRHPKASIKGLFLTGTPEQLNWGYELLEENKAKDTKVYVGSTYDNVKYVGSEYIEFLLEHYSKREIEAYVHGKFINLMAGVVYYSFNEKKNILQSFGKYSPTKTLEIYCDFNVDLMCWSIGQEIKRGKDRIDVIFDNVNQEHNASTRKMCDMLLNKKYKYAGGKTKHKGNYIFYVDIAGTHRSPSATMSSIGIIRHYFPKAKVYYQNIKHVKDRIDATNGRFENYNNRNRLFITKDQKMLINDVRKTTWNHLLHRVKQGKLTHPSDGLTYGMYWKYPLHPRARGRQLDGD